MKTKTVTPKRMSVAMRVAEEVTSRVAAVGSELLQRAQLAMRAGFQFGTKRDLYAVFGYKTKLEYLDFLARYYRQDIARRIVNAPIKAVWRNPPKIKADETFVKEWEALVKEHNLWLSFERLECLASLGQFSILLIGYDDGLPLDAPATGGNRRKVIYTQPYSEASVEITAFEGDATNPRFGLPQMYRIKTTDPGSTAITSGVGGLTSVRSELLDLQVHHSRVLHVARIELEDNVLGVPELTSIFNLLDDLMKVVGGSAETFWLTGNRGMQADIDKEMDITPSDEDALADEIEEFQHQLRRVIRTRGVKLTPLGSDTPDPRGSFEIIIKLISAATGIPQRILMGAEAGQLASEQDRANWATVIEERRASGAEPMILTPFIKKSIEVGVLPDPGDFEFEWPSAFRMSPLEDAQRMAQQARSLVNMSKQAQANFPLITREEGRAILGLPPKPEPGMGTLDDIPLPMDEEVEDPENPDPDGDRDDEETERRRREEEEEGSR